MENNYSPTEVKEIKAELINDLKFLSDNGKMLNSYQDDMVTSLANQAQYRLLSWKQRCWVTSNVSAVKREIEQVKEAGESPDETVGDYHIKTTGSHVYPVEGGNDIYREVDVIHLPTGQVDSFEVNAYRHTSLPQPSDKQFSITRRDGKLYLAKRKNQKIIKELGEISIEAIQALITTLPAPKSFWN